MAGRKRKKFEDCELVIIHDKRVVYSDGCYTITVYGWVDRMTNRMSFTVQTVNDYCEEKYGYGILYDSGDFHEDADKMNEKQINDVINTINSLIKEAFKELAVFERSKEAE